MWNQYFLLTYIFPHWQSSTKSWKNIQNQPNLRYRIIKNDFRTRPCRPQVSFQASRNVPEHFWDSSQYSVLVITNSQNSLVREHIKIRKLLKSTLGTRFCTDPFTSSILWWLESMTFSHIITVVIVTESRFSILFRKYLTRSETHPKMSS